MRPAFVIVASCLLLAACASATPGARPMEMSASEHANAAATHEGEAASHAATADPKAASPKTPCGGGSMTKLDDGPPCWTVSVTSAERHGKEASEHQKMAADHRAASQTLRDAEGKSCGGLTAADRDDSPFAHRDDITAVSRIDASVPSGKGTTTRLAGASVALRAVPGLTPEYLQRIVDCHLARNASMGFSMPEMAFCPLSVKGARATVVASGAALKVEIRADDADAATDVLTRARALVPGN